MNIQPWMWMSAPIPDFLELQTLHTARLMLGLRTGAMAPALTEARALSRLAGSTEIVIGEMIALAMLSNQQRAIDEAKRRGLDVAGFDDATHGGSDDVTIARLKRACFAAPMPFALDQPRTGLEDKVHLCRCSGLQESVNGADFFRPFLFDRYEVRYTALDDELSRSTCRLKNLRKSWTAGASRSLRENLDAFCAVASDDGADPFCQGRAALVYMPFVREAIGETLLAIAGPSWLGRYHEPLPSLSPDAPSAAPAESPPTP